LPLLLDSHLLHVEHFHVLTASKCSKHVHTLWKSSRISFPAKSIDMCLVYRLLLRTTAHHRTDNLPLAPPVNSTVAWPLPFASDHVADKARPSHVIPATNNYTSCMSSIFPLKITKSYKGIVSQVAPSSLHARARKFPPKQICRASRTPVPKSSA
jgi:hypothetical protein